MEKHQPAQPTAEQRFSKQDFRLMLTAMLDEAHEAGKASVDIRAADLHGRVGGFPGRGHAMPTCCSAMRDEMQPGDRVMAEPVRGQGPTLHIRYGLPRPNA